MNDTAVDFQRRILIVTHVFPPAGGIPVQRALSFAKYLPDSGFSVHVLTAKNPAAPVVDPGLLRHVPEEVVVHRSFTPELPFGVRRWLWSRLSGSANKSGPRTSKESPTPQWKRAAKGVAQRVFRPDPEVVWAPFAKRAAERVVKRHRIDTLLVTAPPFSAFLIGNYLKSRFPHLTYVADFRDEWLGFYLSTFDFHSSDAIREQATRIERQTIESSDFVLSITQSALGAIAERHQDQPDSKFIYLPNGYDPDVFHRCGERARTGNDVVITHVGTVYRTSSPRYYLDCVDALPESLRSRIVTRFVGRIADDQKPLFDGRKSRVELLGFMPQEEARRYLEDTDYLLLALDDPKHMTGKIFEYLATGRPILAFAPKAGEIDQVLDKTRSGWCVDPGDGEGGQTLLRNAVQRLDGGDIGISPDWQEVKRFERPRLAAELGRLIQERKG